MRIAFTIVATGVGFLCWKLWLVYQAVQVGMGG